MSNIQTDCDLAVLWQNKKQRRIVDLRREQRLNVQCHVFCFVFISSNLQENQ